MSNPVTHPREEEAAAYVFGHMDVVERAAFVRDLEGDAVLRQVVQELEATAAAMSLALPQAAPSAALKSRVLHSVKGITQEGRGKLVATGRSGRGAAIVGWAAAAALAIFSGVLWERLNTSEQSLATSEHRLAEAKDWAKKTETLIAESRTKSDELKASLESSEKAKKDLQQSYAKTTAAADVLRQEVTRLTTTNKALENEIGVVAKGREMDKMQIANLQSTVTAYKQGVAVVVWDSAKQEGVLKLEKMPPLDSNKDYQLWVVDPSKDKPVNAGVVRVNPEGFAKVQFKPTIDIQKADKFALSVEKKVEDPSGVPVGAGPIVLISP
ncbi:MAG: hypothetical protein JWO89_1898 [Verrucomicrobiaceae bacterium]|nr:hypothetical protein [Verrucomicrobiaceae bacterium]